MTASTTGHAVKAYSYFDRSFQGEFKVIRTTYSNTC